MTISTQTDEGTVAGGDKQGKGVDTDAEKLNKLFLTKYRLENCGDSEVEEVVASCKVLSTCRKASRADRVIQLTTHRLGTGSYG
jgi:hypothetical protein